MQGISPVQTPVPAALRAESVLRRAAVEDRTLPAVRASVQMGREAPLRQGAAATGRCDGGAVALAP